MNRNITYGIDTEGVTYSRVGSEVACGVLDYENIGVGGDYSKPLRYDFKKFPAHSLQGTSVMWTRLLPMWLKNEHRSFWNMKALLEEKPVPRWFLDWGGPMCCPDEPEWTAPKSLKDKLLELGCSNVRRTAAYSNKSIGLVYVFDLPSVKIENLDAEVSRLGFSHLSSSVCRWQ